MREVKKTLELSQFTLCYSYMKRIPLDSLEHAEIWCDVAYRGWNKRKLLKDLDLDFNGVVHQAYSALFDLVHPTHIKVKYYLRLSHVYIAEGSLPGALRTTIMASAGGGHLVHPAIVLQRWLLLKRLVVSKSATMENEIAECLSYLISAIGSEDRDIDEHTGVAYVEGCPDLPMYIIYLILASHLHNHIRTHYANGPPIQSPVRKRRIISNQSDFQNNVTPVKKLKSSALIHDMAMSRNFSNLRRADTSNMTSKKEELESSSLLNMALGEDLGFAASASSTTMGFVPGKTNQDMGQGPQSILSKALNQHAGQTFPTAQSFGGISNGGSLGSPTKGIEFIVRSKDEAVEILISFLHEAHDQYELYSSIDMEKLKIEKEAEAVHLALEQKQNHAITSVDNLRNMFASKFSADATSTPSKITPPKAKSTVPKALAKKNIKPLKAGSMASVQASIQEAAAASAAALREEKREGDMLENELAVRGTRHTEKPRNGKLPLRDLLKWFRRRQLWMDVGKSLETISYDAPSSLILLSEECYYEAFVRAPLLEQSLEYIVHLMGERHTSKTDLRRYFEETIYTVCPWNLYCRKLLVTIDDKEENILNWESEFEYQRKCLVLVQKWYRGYYLRSQWEGIAEKAWEIKKNHLEKVGIAMIWFNQQLTKTFHANFLLWRSNARALKQLKAACALKIQYNLRGHWVREFYKRELKRVEEVNFRYLIACQNMSNTSRIRHLQEWNKTFHQVRNDRCADCLRITILANSYSMIMAESMEKIVGVVKIRRRYSNTKCFRFWLQLQLHRRKLHAICTIRFFVRNAFLRVKMREKEAYLLVLEQKAKIFEDRMNLPLVTNSFKHWHGAYMFSRWFNAQLMLINWGRRMLAMIHYRRLVRRRRALAEASAALILHRRWKKMHKFFKRKWLKNHMATKIERCMRICISRCRVLRRIQLLQDVELHRLRHFRRILKSRVFRWKKMIYLIWRCRHRACNRVIKYFRLLIVRARMRRLMLRKQCIRRFMQLTCKSFLNFSFHELHNNTINRYKYVTLQSLIRRGYLYTTKCALKRWKNLANEDRILKGMLALRSKYEVDFCHWIGAHYSIQIRRQLTHTVGGYTAYFYDESIEEAEDLEEVRSMYTPEENLIPIRNALPWEHLIPPQKTIISLNKAQNAIKVAPLGLHLGFRAWVAAYRMRRKTKMKVALPMAKVAILDKLYSSIFERGTLAVRIQRFWRICIARRVVLRERNRARRFYESTLKINRAKKQFWLNVLVDTTSNRIWARNTLHLFFRRCRAKKRLSLIRKKVQHVHDCFVKVHSSAFQHRRFRLIMGFMQSMYCKQTLYSNQGYSKTTSRNCNRLEAFPSIVDNINASIIDEISTTPVNVSVHRKRIGSKSIQKRSQRTNYSLEEHSMPDDPYTGDDTIFYKNTHIPTPYHKPAGVVLATTSAYKNENRAGIGGIDFAVPAKPSKMKKKMPNANSIGAIQHSGVNLEFQSAAFHSHLFRIRQTGIFILDLRNNGKIGTENDKLTKEEAIYCLQQASTLFCPIINVKVVEVVIQYFVGDKLVLCGGVSVQQNMIIFLKLLHEYLSQRSRAMTDEKLLNMNTENPIKPLCLHISDMFMTFEASNLLSRCVSCNYYATIRELSVDSVSLGVLGVSLLFHAMKSNTHIETLIVNCAAYDCIDGYADSLAASHENSTLKVGVMLKIGFVFVMSY